MDFLAELSNRNIHLYIFGWVCVAGSFACILCIFLTQVEVLGINAFIKPLKFFLSTVIFSWTMAWYLGYLDVSFTTKAYTWTVILVLSFELFWITYKAAIGELSHFNISSSFNGFMFSMMGISISIMTLFTLYIGILFWVQSFPQLPLAYLWGIRLGIICFVIFAFQGGIMGAQLAHTVGAADGGPGLPLVNWSTKFGDYRIAHFVGMHALQILPLIGYYLLTSTKGIVLFSILYFGLCLAVLIQAMMKMPLLRF